MMIPIRELPSLISKDIILHIMKKHTKYKREEKAFIEFQNTFWDSF